MNANVMKTNNGKRLLALVAVFAMVACCLVAVAPAADADSATPATSLEVQLPGGSVTEVSTFDTLKAELTKETPATAIAIVAAEDATVENPTTIAISEDLTIPAGTTVYIAGATFENWDNTKTNVKVTVNQGVTLTVAGTLYSNGGTSKSTTALAVNGDLELTGSGKVFLTAAISFGANSGVTGFFTSPGGALNYRQVYTAAIGDITSYVIANDYNNDFISPEKKTAKAIFTYGDVKINSTVSLSDTTLMIGGVSGADSKVSITGASTTFTGEVMNAKDGASATLTAIGSGADDKSVVLGQGSITISGTIDASSTATINAKGQLVIDGEIVGESIETLKIITTGTGNEVVIQDLKITGATLEIQSGANATVAEGATVTGDITNKGNLALNGTVEGKVKNEKGAETVVGTNGTATEFYGDGKVSSSTAQGGDNTGFQGQLNFNLEISTPEFLSGNYTIAEGYTFTIKAGGSLALEGKQLVVNGTLVIENGGAITGLGTVGEGIILTDKGTIQNSGVIGKGGFAVDVMAYQDGTDKGRVAGSVSLQNVTGISFALDKTVIPATQTAQASVQYQLAFSGNAVRNGTGTYMIDADGALINGDLTIGNSVTFIAADTTVDGVTVTVNGIVGGELTLTSGSTVVMNGQTAEKDADNASNPGKLTLTALTGEYVTSQKADMASVLATTTVTVENVRGLTVEVVSESYMDEKVSMTERCSSAEPSPRPPTSEPTASPPAMLPTASRSPEPPRVTLTWGSTSRESCTTPRRPTP